MKRFAALAPLAALATLTVSAALLLLRPLLPESLGGQGIPGELPDPSTLISTEVLDRQGNPLTIALNNREERALALDLDAAPRWVREAFIVAEDRRFYQHPGVDPAAVLRAAWNSLRKRRVTSGASTITMQLARIYWPELAPASSKAAQMVQALRLERVHSKDEILRRYLSLIPFAHQVSGIRQACLRFFDKACDRLSPAEAATLAVIPRNPAYYLKNRKALLHRRNKILAQLRLRLGWQDLIYNQAVREPLTLRQGEVATAARHFIERILRTTSDSGPVRTTLDGDLQSSFQELLAESIRRNPSLGDTGAILVVDNQTAGVLAYVGSPGYFHERHGMVDNVHSLRSPGSTLKPFVYALALEKGWMLSSPIPDIPQQWKITRGVFAPNNYGKTFSGPRQLRFALANSKNLPILHLTQRLGEASVLRFLLQAGFRSLDLPAEHYGVGLSLGNGEVSLWELVQSYSGLARGGVVQPLAILESEKQAAPTRTESAEPRAKRMMSRETAFLIANVLKDNAARAEEFGRGGPLEFDYEVSVKTGTSSAYRDHWTVGFTKDFTVGVWKGNADGTALARRQPASRSTGTLFKKVMTRLHRETPPAASVRPQKIVEHRICSLSGALPGPFCTSTRQEIFRLGHEPTESCGFHRQTTVPQCGGKAKTVRYLQLPAEYSVWANARGIATIEKALSQQCGWGRPKIAAYLAAHPEDYGPHHQELPKIIDPVSGTIFALDPHIPRDHQKIRFALSRVAQQTDAVLLVNGSPFARLYGKSYIDWPIQRGSWALQVSKNGAVNAAVDGTGDHSVRFEVR